MTLRTHLLAFAALLACSGAVRADVVIQIGLDPNNPTEVFNNGTVTYVPVLISGSGNLSDFTLSFQITDYQIVNGNPVALNVLTPVTPLGFVLTGNGPTGDPTTDKTFADPNYIFHAVGSLYSDDLGSGQTPLGNASSPDANSSNYTLYAGGDFGDEAVALTSSGAVLVDLAVQFGPASTTNLTGDTFQISLLSAGTAFDFVTGPSLGLSDVTVNGGLVKVDNPALAGIPPIPEPSTLIPALGGLALGGVMAWRRRLARL